MNEAAPAMSSATAEAICARQWDRGIPRDILDSLLLVLRIHKDLAAITMSGRARHAWMCMELGVASGYAAPSSARLLRRPAPCRTSFPSRSTGG